MNRASLIAEGRAERIIQASRKYREAGWRNGHFVYFIRAGRSGAIKIGYSNDPFTRLRRLRDGNPYRLRLLMTIPGNDEVEKTVHRMFTQCRLRGEWFAPSRGLVALIRCLRNTLPPDLAETRPRTRKLHAPMWLVPEPEDQRGRWRTQRRLRLEKRRATIAAKRAAAEAAVTFKPSDAPANATAKETA